MVTDRRIELKPLSFSTTLRNPMRIVDFLEIIAPYEGKVLDNELILTLVKKIIKNKIYTTMYEKQNMILKSILDNPDAYFTDLQLEQIINLSPQNHKEAGFGKGWPSRFDTWYKLIKEFGFLYYKYGKKIEISESGRKLIAASKNDSDEANELISRVFTNALCKYQTNNPFRRNAIDNAPFVLFLSTVKVLKNNYSWEKSGIYRTEIPLVLCWPDNDSVKLADYINEFRSKYGKKPSSEIVYEHCLKLLNSENRIRYKINQLIHEGPDDFIRKLRTTGLISIRGMGHLIDINNFEDNIITYLINNYSNYPKYSDEYQYYKYSGAIDKNIFKDLNRKALHNSTSIKESTLKKWATEVDSKIIDDELIILGSRNRASRHEVFKLIDEPTRLEFLVSIALTQQFPELVVSPNYTVDDEGLPKFTAKGGVGDIEIVGQSEDVLVEVTLQQNKSQAVNEIPGITRHLKTFSEEKNKSVYGLFVAPSLHEDTNYMLGYSYNRYNVEINGYTIEEFLKALRNSHSISDMRLSA